MGKRKKVEEELFECLEDFEAEVFAEGVRGPREEYRGKLALLVPFVVVLPDDAQLELGASEALLDGRYVELTGSTSRKECRDVLGERTKVLRAKANRAFDVMEAHGLKAPS